MLDLKQSTMAEAGGMSPVSLAFIGDCVFELMVREQLVSTGGMPAGKLHRLAVGRVRATAQAAAFETIHALCDEEERSILRRGRNVSLSRIPRSCTPEQYHKATGIEALFGYLYLMGRIDRLRTLFAQMEEVADDASDQTKPL